MKWIVNNWTESKWMSERIEQSDCVAFEADDI